MLLVITIKLIPEKVRAKNQPSDEASCDKAFRAYDLGWI